MSDGKEGCTKVNFLRLLVWLGKEMHRLEPEVGQAVKVFPTMSRSVLHICFLHIPVSATRSYKPAAGQQPLLSFLGVSGEKKTKIILKEIKEFMALVSSCSP